MNTVLHLADAVFSRSAPCDEFIQALSSDGGRSVKNVGKLRKLCAPLQTKLGERPRDWGGDATAAKTQDLVALVGASVNKTVAESSEAWREHDAQQRLKAEQFSGEGQKEWEAAAAERAAMRDRWLEVKAQVDKEEDDAAARFDKQARSVVAAVVSFGKQGSPGQRQAQRQVERQVGQHHKQAQGQQQEDQQGDRQDNQQQQQEQQQKEQGGDGSQAPSRSAVKGDTFSSFFSPFSKSKNEQDDLSSAADYLRSLKLEAYAEQLSHSLGADTVADLREATEDDLIEAGMKKLHARRLAKALQR